MRLCGTDEEDRRGRVWRDLRRVGHGDEGGGGPQARVGQTTETSAQNGSGRLEKTPRYKFHLP